MRNVWLGISTTFVGMRLTIGYFFKPKFTEEYPEVPPYIPKGDRGLHNYMEPKCILCHACEKICPVDCITIDAVGRGKEGMVTQFDIDYSRCLFCGLCVEACPVECLWMTEQFDLSGYSREACVLRFACPKSEQDKTEHEALLEKRAAEKKAKREAEKKAKEAAEEKKDTDSKPNDG